MADTAHVDVPLPGMPPEPPPFHAFTDERIRRHAAEAAEFALHELADHPLLWQSLPGSKSDIDPDDVDRLRTEVLKIADEVSDRG